MERNYCAKVNDKGEKRILAMGELCKVPFDNIYLSLCDERIDLNSYYINLESELLQVEPKALKYKCAIDDSKSITSLYGEGAFLHAPLIIEYMGDLCFRELISDVIFNLYVENEGVFGPIYDLETYKANYRYLMEHPLVINEKHITLCGNFYNTFVWYAKSNLTRQDKIVKLLQSAENKNRKLLRKEYTKVMSEAETILDEQRYFTMACDFINKKRFNVPKVKTYARYMNEGR